MSFYLTSRRTDDLYVSKHVVHLCFIYGLLSDVADLYCLRGIFVLFFLYTVTNTIQLQRTPKLSKKPVAVFRVRCHCGIETRERVMENIDKLNVLSM